MPHCWKSHVTAQIFCSLHFEIIITCIFKSTSYWMNLYTPGWNFIENRFVRIVSIANIVCLIHACAVTLVLLNLYVRHDSTHKLNRQQCLSWSDGLVRSTVFSKEDISRLRRTCTLWTSDFKSSQYQNWYTTWGKNSVYPDPDLHSFQKRV